MTKNTSSFDDQIDLIRIIRLFIAHKAKFITLGIFGLAFGIFYAFQLEPRFETKFKIHVGHPIILDNFLINSSDVQEMLDSSELNNQILPNYKFNKKAKLFTVITKTKDELQDVTEQLTDAMKKELIKLTKTASTFEKFDQDPINNKNALLTWTNQDIVNMDVDQVVQTLSVNFSEPKLLNSSPGKYGVVGFFLGLVLAFAWMFSQLLICQLKKK